MVTWIVSMSWLLWIVLLWTLGFKYPFKSVFLLLFCYVSDLYPVVELLDHIVASSFLRNLQTIFHSVWSWFQIYVIYQSHIYKTAKRSVVTQGGRDGVMKSLSLEDSHDNENNLYNAVVMDSCPYAFDQSHRIYITKNEP